MKDFFKLDKLNIIFNYVFWFLCLNIFFLIFNLPGVLFISFLGIENILNLLPLFLLCLIPTGPSFSIMLYSMGKIIKEKHLNIVHDIATGFKLNFKQSLLIWCSELIFIFILYSNIRFFIHISNTLIITAISISLLILIGLVTPFLFILISRFSMGTYDIIRNSFILAVTRPILAITNLLALAVTLIIFEFSPANATLFIGSIFTYLILYINKGLLLELEKASLE